MSKDNIKRPLLPLAPLGVSVRLGGKGAAFEALRRARLVQRWQSAADELGARETSHKAPIWRLKDRIQMYFDTPDNQLFAHGTVLRLDKQGDRYCQYLQTDGKVSHTPLSHARAFPKKLKHICSNLPEDMRRLPAGEFDASKNAGNSRNKSRPREIKATHDMIKGLLEPYMCHVSRGYKCDIMFGDVELNLSVEYGRIKVWDQQNFYKEHPFESALLSYHAGNLDSFYSYAKALCRECGLVFDGHGPEEAARALIIDRIEKAGQASEANNGAQVSVFDRLDLDRFAALDRPAQNALTNNSKACARPIYARPIYARPIGTRPEFDRPACDGVAVLMRPSRPDFSGQDAPISVEDLIARSLMTAQHQIEDGHKLLLSDNARGIKKMRVGLRRFRAIEQAFRPIVKCPQLSHLSAVARGASRRLGVLRDLEVLAWETLPDIAARAGGRLPEGIRLDILAAYAGARYYAQWRALDASIRNGKYSDFLLSLSQYCTMCKWQESLTPKQQARIASTDIHPFSRQSLDRRLKKAKSAAKKLEETPIDASHPLRIEVKKLRYSAQALRGLYDKAARMPYMQALSRLQSVFGSMNDAQVALALTGSFIDEPLDALRVKSAKETRKKDLIEARAFLNSWYANDIKDQTQKVCETWAALDAMPPFWRD